MAQARLVDLDRDRLSLGPGLGLMLACSIGGESVVAALVDAAGTAHCVHEATIAPGQLGWAPRRLMPRVRDAAVAVLEQGLATPGLRVPSADGEHLRVIGATVAWPVAMDRETRPVGGALQGGWSKRTSLRTHLHRGLGLPLRRCHAMNDANAGALTLAYEWDEAGDETIMCLHVAAGIGLGTVHLPIREPYRSPFIKAQLVGGRRRGLAGEIGHCKLDQSLIDELNRPLTNGSWKLRKLDGQRGCPGCGVDYVGHVDAVIGARAVLERLSRFVEGETSLVEGLRELHRDVERNVHEARHALKDVGRALGRVMDGAVATLDPAKITLVGAMSSQLIAEGMLQRAEQGDLNHDVQIAPYPRGTLHTVALRGAALSAIRSGLYRGFFDNLQYHGSVKQVYSGPDPWSRWSGWDSPLEGVQTGWDYEPMRVDQTFIEDMRASTHR